MCQEPIKKISLCGVGVRFGNREWLIAVGPPHIEYVPKCFICESAPSIAYTTYFALFTAEFLSDAVFAIR